MNRVDEPVTETLLAVQPNSVIEEEEEVNQDIEICISGERAVVDIHEFDEDSTWSRASIDSSNQACTEGVICSTGEGTREESESVRHTVSTFDESSAQHSAIKEAWIEGFTCNTGEGIREESENNGCTIPDFGESSTQLSGVILEDSRIKDRAEIVVTSQVDGECDQEAFFSIGDVSAVDNASDAECVSSNDVSSSLASHEEGTNSGTGPAVWNAWGGEQLTSTDDDSQIARRLAYQQSLVSSMTQTEEVTVTQDVQIDRHSDTEAEPANLQSQREEAGENSISLQREFEEALSKSREDEVESVKEGCAQFLDEVLTQSEYERLEEDNNIKQRQMCVVCLERERCRLFMPCSHFLCCKECSEMLRNLNNECPYCRGTISSVENVFW